MTAFTPLSSHNPPGREPTLVINRAADYEQLTSAADDRLSAARDLLETAALSADSASGLSGIDLHNVAWAAHLLTSDALDLFRASTDVHEREVLESQGAIF